MKFEQVASSNPSFEFLRFWPQEESWSGPDTDLHVENNAFWSYCGPQLTEDEGLPPNFHEWASTALSGSLLPRLMPFLEFVNRYLRDNDLRHYWLTIRATKATSEFDKPRWHTDDMFFSGRAGGLRPLPRQNSEDESDRALDLQTDWKLCTSLLGPSTMFIPDRSQSEARKTQRSTRNALTTEHECTSIRCIACAATSDAVRERLASELKCMGTVQATPGQCAFFRIGPKNGAVHSEPRMDGGDRIFVNVVPGRELELENLMTRWGMNFPRSWWIAPNVARGRDASLWKY